MSATLRLGFDPTFSYLDFESDPSFELLLRASDAGGLFAEQWVRIETVDVNEIPVMDDGVVRYAVELKSGYSAFALQ